MKILTCLLFLFATVSAAWAVQPGGEPAFVRPQLPATDADLERAEHAAKGPQFSIADTVANRVGIRNGGAELFDNGDLGIESNAHFSAGIGSKGATFTIRW